VRAVPLLLAVACTEGRASPEAYTSPPPAVTAPQPEDAAADGPGPVAPSLAARAAVLVHDAGSGWCTEGLEALDDETCLVVPQSTVQSPRTLLIYLHGVIAPTGQPQSFVQGIVRDDARARGYVALLPRGVRGIGPVKTHDWWAWPTDAAAYAAHARSMVAGWLAKRRAIEEALGAPFERTYLAGSSNGAYFVTILALRGDIAVDGFAAISGGARGGRQASGLPAVRPPFFVGYGSLDEAKGDPMGLGALLVEAGWPHRLVEHPVPHGLRGVFLEDAFSYWQAP
jgi:predicted esterase